MKLIAVAMLSIALVTSVAVAGPTASAAVKQTPAKVYKACANGKSLKKFKKKTLKKALRKMPKDIKQYTECPAKIKKAIRKKNRR